METLTCVLFIFDFNFPKLVLLVLSMPLSCFFVIFCKLKSLHISILKCDISYRVRNGLTNLNIVVTHLLFEMRS